MKAWSCTYRSTCLYRRVLFPTVHFSYVPVCLYLHLSVSIRFQYFVSIYNSLLNQLLIDVHVGINYIELFFPVTYRIATLLTQHVSIK